MNKNDTLAAYIDFTKWSRDNLHLDLDSRLHSHGGSIGDGGYISDEKTRAAFAAWRAAIEVDRKATEKQLTAYRGVVNSLEARLTHLQAQHDELKKSANPDLLASERAANAMLTEELEADRKRQPRADTETLQQLNEVLQYLEIEVMKLEAAYGHNFKPHATKKARATVEKLKAAMCTISKRRGEPVAWLYEDELPDNYPYDTMFPYSKVDGVRMFPVYAPQPAEPVKVPSDKEIAKFARDMKKGLWVDDTLILFARALLATYGQPAQPAEDSSLDGRPPSN